MPVSFDAYRKRAERIKKLEAVYDAAQNLLNCYRYKKPLMDCMIKLYEAVHAVENSKPPEAS